MVIGSGRDVGEAIIQDKRLSLISFTGSTPIGRRVSEIVAKRFGTSILELGGNNALLVNKDANLDIAIPAIVFGSVGTAGQRCTSTRRVIIHEDVYDTVVSRMTKAYDQVRIGDPLDESTLMGPLHTPDAIKEYTDGLAEIKKQGGKILKGGNVLSDMGGNFVEPTIVEIDPNADIINTELFVPIVYVLKAKDIDHAIQMNNQVPQGLSSALFTDSSSAVEQFLGPNGSDCGLANINAGTSGAEIGGAFGGEKETGNGREAGSDSWKQYCRRQTSAINYGSDLPLAQGIVFE